MRSAFLRDKNNYGPQASGGCHRTPWPAKTISFLEAFLPLQSPPNYQLVADELERLCDFKRARSNVEAYVKEHLAHLVPACPRKTRPYRRFRRAHIGELWQHDSSIHQWWPAPAKQTLLALGVAYAKVATRNMPTKSCKWRSAARTAPSTAAPHSCRWRHGIKIC